MRQGRKSGSGRSLKTQRWLDEAGVEEKLAGGATIVTVGRTYRWRDGQSATLAFARDDEGRICVGYAVGEGSWVMVEAEPYTARSFGYYKRWLKRHRELGD